MLTLRRSEDRGHAEHGWLDSRHTFSFADYYDPQHMGFRSLRVINEDRVQPGKGFGTHGHRDMEILSYVLAGALEHKDSMGTGSVIRPGDVQRMSAGTGVLHSEYNASAKELVHFLQIWLLPDRPGITPSYEQKTFALDEKRNRLRLIASPLGQDGSVTLHADARVHAAVLDGGAAVEHIVGPGRHAWIQVTRGRVVLDAGPVVVSGPLPRNGQELQAGDGASTSSPGAVRIESPDGGDVLVFDLG